MTTLLFAYLGAFCFGYFACEAIWRLIGFYKDKP